MTSSAIINSRLGRLEVFKVESVTVYELGGLWNELNAALF